VRIVEPGRYRHSVVWVKDVRCGRVIDDDAVFHLSAQLRQVLDVSNCISSLRRTYLDVIALVVVTTFSEQTMSNNTASVEHVKYGIGILIGQPELQDKNMIRLTLEREAVKMTTS
jgi:hypothetical protein